MKKHTKNAGIWVIRALLLIGSLGIYYRVINRIDFPLYAGALIVLIALLLFAMESARRNSGTRLDANEKLVAITKLEVSELTGAVQEVVARAGYEVTTETGLLATQFIASNGKRKWCVQCMGAGETLDRNSLKELSRQAKVRGLQGAWVIKPARVEAETKQLAKLKNVSIIDYNGLWKLLELSKKQTADKSESPNLQEA